MLICARKVHINVYVYTIYIYLYISVYIYLTSTTLQEKQCRYGKHFETSHDHPPKYFQSTLPQEKIKTLLFFILHINIIRN